VRQDRDDATAAGDSMTLPTPQYTRSEKIADRVVHAIGVPAGMAAAVVLIVVTALAPEGARLISVTLYGFGLVAMLSGSAAYNIVEHPTRKEFLRRLDHAGIFVMIAGTYTPFTLVSLGGALGIAYCVAMWVAAAGGVLLKLRFPRRFERLSIVLYLVMGWSVLALVPELAGQLSDAVLILLAAGGVLYTAGVAFHVAHGLRFHNAVWHVCVLAAASLHYIAIFQGVALEA
jgi:hemolysin III